MNIKLKKETEEILKLAKIVGESILDTYMELTELESKNMKIKEEYFQKLVTLNQSIKLQNEIISRIFLDTSEIMNLLFYFFELLKDKDEISSIVNLDKEKLINLRIIEIINYYMLANPRKLIDCGLNRVLSFLSEETIDLEELDDNRDIRKIQKEAEETSICLKALKDDLDYMFMVLLNHKISSEPEKDLKSKLIRSKYLKIYTSPNIEEELLNKAFNLPEEAFINVYLQASLSNIDSNFTSKLINNQVQSLSLNDIYALLPKQGVYIGKPKIELELREISIRTTTAFLTPEEITKTKEFLEDYLNNTDELTINYYRESASTLLSALQSLDEDRNYVKKVTLK